MWLLEQATYLSFICQSIQQLLSTYYVPGITTVLHSENIATTMKCANSIGLSALHE